MPLYEYSDTRTGATVELARPVSQRDDVPPYLLRQCVPRRLAVLTNCLEPSHPDRAVPKAFRDLESGLNHREIARQSGFTTEQVKRIWNM